MRLYQMLNALKNAIGPDDTKESFFKTLFKEISTDAIDDSIFPKPSTIRACFSENEKGKEFYQEIIFYINNKAIYDFFSEVFEDEAAQKRFRDYLEEHDVYFYEDDITLCEAVAEEFLNAITEKVYCDDRDIKVVKKLLKKTQVLFELMNKNRREIYNYSLSVAYSNVVPDAKLRELKEELNKVYNDFKNTNEELLNYNNRFTRLNLLYKLSLFIDPDEVINPFNMSDAYTKYNDCLNYLIQNI